MRQVKRCHRIYTLLSVLSVIFSVSVLFGIFRDSNTGSSTTYVPVALLTHLSQSSRSVLAARADTARTQMVSLLPSRTDGRTNFVFLLADDLGYGDVGYNGGGAATPTLDAMAAGENSLLLTRSYSGSPVCSPTRGTLLTGRNHNRYCMWRANSAGMCNDGECPSRMPLPPSEISVAEILRNQGYHTAVFGKWHVGDLRPLKGGHDLWPVSHPGMHGFEDWLVTERSGITATPNCGCFHNATCLMGHCKAKAKQYCRNYYYLSKENNKIEGYDEPIPGDDSHFILDKFEDYLRKVTKSGSPFFIYLPFHTVHARFVAVEPYKSYYTSQGYDALTTDYYGSITAMDEVIGRIRELLKAYNVSENTMLWFTSDNGPARPKDGSKGVGSSGGLRGWKGTVYEGGIRVPGIIEWPRMIMTNRKSNFSTVTSDFLPTVCDILGIEPPTDRAIDGISILPLIQNTVQHRGKPIAFAYRILNRFESFFQAALNGDHFKLIAHYQGKKPVQYNIYDIVNDPWEEVDLVEQEAEIVETMSRELDSWVQSVERSAEMTGCLNHSIARHCFCSKTGSPYSTGYTLTNIIGHK